MSSKEPGVFKRYWNPAWFDVAEAATPLVLQRVRDDFISAVDKRLMADVPYGVLLSGGLDSSLCASVIARLKRQRFLKTGKPDDLEPLKSFSIGLEGAPDLEAAQTVADFIGTEHYGFTFTVQEGIDAARARRRRLSLSPRAQRNAPLSTPPPPTPLRSPPPPLRNARAR